MRTFVVSDIHGDYTGMIDVLEQFFHAGWNAHKDRVVFLGDYVDGYDRTAEVIEHIRILERSFGKDHIVCLRGNHEDMMIEGHDKAWYDPTFRLWYEQGGKATAASYGVQDLGGSPYLDIPPQAKDDIEWMKTLRYRFEDDHYHYVHAGFRPGVPLDEQTEYDMVWIREVFLYNDYDFGKMVIVGHTPVEEPVVLPTKIMMDTRARGEGFISGAEVFPDKPPVFYKPGRNTGITT